MARRCRLACCYFGLPYSTPAPTWPYGVTLLRPLFKSIEPLMPTWLLPPAAVVPMAALQADNMAANNAAAAKCRIVCMVFFPYIGSDWDVKPILRRIGPPCLPRRKHPALQFLARPARPASAWPRRRRGRFPKSAARPARPCCGIRPPSPRD